MYKYAEIYGGKVRDLKESNLGYTEFCSIFSPVSYWLDVTGVDDIEIGYLIKFEATVGTYFEAPEEITEDTFEVHQAAKLEELAELFSQAAEAAYVESSLGFKADANEEASRNVSGLLTLLAASSETTVQFCDYDNDMQELTLEQLTVLQLEILQNATYLYQQKWALRDAIEAATTDEDLEAITIAFYYKSYTSDDEETSDTAEEETTEEDTEETSSTTEETTTDESTEITSEE